jgi:hypothetical protein
LAAAEGWPYSHHGVLRDVPVPLQTVLLFAFSSPPIAKLAPTNRSLAESVKSGRQKFQKNAQASHRSRNCDPIMADDCPFCPIMADDCLSCSIVADDCLFCASCLAAVARGFVVGDLGQGASFLRAAATAF